MWAREYYRKHFESLDLQRAKAKAKSEKLDKDTVEKSKKALQKAKVFLSVGRKIVKYNEEKCDSNRECLKRQKKPCLFTTEDKEVSHVRKDIIADKVSK